MEANFDLSKLDQHWFFFLKNSSSYNFNQNLFKAIIVFQMEILF